MPPVKSRFKIQDRTPLNTSCGCHIIKRDVCDDTMPHATNTDTMTTITSYISHHHIAACTCLGVEYTCLTIEVTSRNNRDAIVTWSLDLMSVLGSALLELVDYHCE